MKKRILLLLAVTACLFFAPSCPALTAAGLETDPVGRKWEGHSFFARMEELTGIHVEGSACEDRKAWDDRLETLRTGDHTDILLKADLTRSQEKALLDDGILIDLAPYLEGCMPNLSALLADHPEWKEQIALEDGRIASLPEINPDSRQVIVWINSQWLQNLGMDMSGSIDELGRALEAFRDKDPNGNGKQDEIPCDFIGMWELRWLLPYFGIAANDWLMEKDPLGNPVFVPESGAYRLFLETLRDWYQRGILRADTFTQTHIDRAYLSDSSQPNLGLFVSITPFTHVPAEHVNQYSALLMPHGGKTVWRRFPGEIWTGCFAVTSSCSSPEDALRWADALYAEEAAILSLAGAEGEDWEWNGDGYWSFIIRPNRTAEDIRRTALMNTGTKMPGLYPVRFAAAVGSPEDRRIAAENRRVRLAAEGTGSVLKPAANAVDQAGTVIAPVTRALDESAAEFITGSAELNEENWAQMLLDLKKAGSDKLKDAFGGLSSYGQDTD